MKQIIVMNQSTDVMVFHIAECQICTPVLPMPFDDRVERDVWLAAHSSATDHAVRVKTEIRIESR